MTADIDRLLAQVRAIWPEVMIEQEIAVAMGVVYGDICRWVRDHSEGKPVYADDLERELGNLILSTIRWCDDLGFSPQGCIQSAMAAQERYRRKNGSPRSWTLPVSQQTNPR